MASIPNSRTRDKSEGLESFTDDSNSNFNLSDDAMSFTSLTQRSTTQQAHHSRQEWEALRETIRELYIDRSMKLGEVRQHLFRHHNFNAQPHEYKLRLQQWGLKKNYSAKQKDELAAQLSRRGADAGQQPFTLNGQPVRIDKILRHQKASQRRSSNTAEAVTATPQPRQVQFPRSQPTLALVNMQLRPRTRPQGWLMSSYVDVRRHKLLELLTFVVENIQTLPGQQLNYRLNDAATFTMGVAMAMTLIAGNHAPHGVQLLGMICDRIPNVIDSNPGPFAVIALLVKLLEGTREITEIPNTAQAVKRICGYMYEMAAIKLGTIHPVAVWLSPTPPGEVPALDALPVLEQYWTAMTQDMRTMDDVDVSPSVDLLKQLPVWQTNDVEVVSQSVIEMERILDKLWEGQPETFFSIHNYVRHVHAVEDAPSRSQRLPR